MVVNQCFEVFFSWPRTPKFSPNNHSVWGRESRSRVTTDVVCHHRMGPSQTDGLDLDQGALWGGCCRGGSFQTLTLWWTYKKLWKDPPCLMGKSTISTGPFYVHQRVSKLQKRFAMSLLVCSGASGASQFFRETVLIEWLNGWWFWTWFTFQ